MIIYRRWIGNEKLFCEYISSLPKHEIEFHLTFAIRDNLQFDKADLIKLLGPDNALVCRNRPDCFNMTYDSSVVHGKHICPDFLMRNPDRRNMYAWAVNRIGKKPSVSILQTILEYYLRPVSNSAHRLIDMFAELHGPYLFGQPDEDIVETCLRSLGDAILPQWYEILGKAEGNPEYEQFLKSLPILERCKLMRKMLRGIAWVDDYIDYPFVKKWIENPSFKIIDHYNNEAMAFVQYRWLSHKPVSRRFIDIFVKHHLDQLDDFLMMVSYNVESLPDDLPLTPVVQRTRDLLAIKTQEDYDRCQQQSFFISLEHAPLNVLRLFPPDVIGIDHFNWQRSYNHDCTIYIYHLIVTTADGYFTVADSDATDKKVTRFFALTAMLPVDLKAYLVQVIGGRKFALTPKVYNAFLDKFGFVAFL